MRTDTPKQMLGESALLELLNWELAAYEQCSGCHFTAVEAGGDGGSSCNWYGARLETDHPLGLAEQSIVQMVVAETKDCYDLALH